MSGKPAAQPSKGAVPPPQKRRGGCLPFVGGLVSAILLIAVLAGAVTYFVAYGPGPAARNGLPATTVMLRQGAGVPEIADDLQKAGVVRSAELFRLAAKLTGEDRGLRAGEYRFPSKASAAEVLRKIQAGEIVRHYLTVPEGWTSAMAVGALNASPLLTGTVITPPEGVLLPQTYEILRGEPRSAVLARMQKAHERMMAKLWPGRVQGLPFTSPQQAVILASIVEKETALPQERPHVAALFENRLRQGMRLESDPTVIYGVSQGRQLGRGLRMSELADPAPYNTYQIAGLPPTPICNPGEASLHAVLNPTASDDLYFVADGGGGHVFAKTYPEHLLNVAKWRIVETARAAKAALTPH